MRQKLSRSQETGSSPTPSRVHASGNMNPAARQRDTTKQVSEARNSWRGSGGRGITDAEVDAGSELKRHYRSGGVGSVFQTGQRPSTLRALLRVLQRNRDRSIQRLNVRQPHQTLPHSSADVPGWQVVTGRAAVFGNQEAPVQNSSG